MEERFPKTKLIVGILTLIGVVVYTGLQFWQTTLIRENNIISQRAFVSGGTTGQLAPVAIITTRQAMIRAFLSFSNSGNTATTGLKVSYKCAPSPSKPPEPFVLLFQENNPEKLTQMLAPHQNGAAFCDFPISHIEQIFKEDEFGYVLGEITYGDRLDSSTLHKTQFALKLTINHYVPGTLTFDDKGLPVGTPPTIEGQFSPVGLHNCADDDCPKN